MTNGGFLSNRLMAPMATVETVTGPVDASELGTTLIHEHLRARDEAAEVAGERALAFFAEREPVQAHAVLGVLPLQPHVRRRLGVAEAEVAIDRVLVLAEFEAAAGVLQGHHTGGVGEERTDVDAIAAGLAGAGDEARHRDEQQRELVHEASRSRRDEGGPRHEWRGSEA